MRRILAIAVTVMVTPILMVAVCLACHRMMTGGWVIGELGESMVAIAATFATVGAFFGVVVATE